MGDRHQQNGVNYTLDLAAGLTQVLADGTNTYLYGNGRIAQVGSTTEYFLGDALGSVRQLTDSASVVTLTQSYAPYGEVVSSTGASQTSYAFTGESRDANGLIYLRARYYAPQDGQFINRDTWSGDYYRPLSLNRWSYVEGNPINRRDPSGMCWYWDPIANKTKNDPLRPPYDEPCNELVEGLGAVGVVLPNEATASNWLSKIPREVAGYFLTCPLRSDYWMVIKYSTSTKWKYFETSSTGVEYKIILGYGGGGTYSCDNISGECSVSGQIELGAGESFAGLKVAIGIGVGAEYNLVQGAFNWGGYADLGHCSAFVSSTKISASCIEGLTGQIDEWGWERLRYREYLVLVNSSTITQYGGYINFGKKRVIPNQYDKSQIRFDIWATNSNKEPLQFIYQVDIYDLQEYP